MPKYEVTDELTGKKFEFEGDQEPTETDISDYLQGTITAKKPGFLEPVRKFEEETIGQETFKDTYTEPTGVPLVKEPLALGHAVFNWTNRQLSRPVTGIQTFVAGEGYKKGFVSPEQAPSFGESAVKAWNIQDKEQAKWVGLFTDIALGLGSYQIVYGYVPKAGMDFVKAYNTKQLKKMGELTATLAEAYTGAGADELTANEMAKAAVAKFEGKGFLNKIKNNPKLLEDTINSIKAGKGDIAQGVQAYGQKLQQLDKASGQARMELANYESWLEGKAPTIRPELKVQLHPAPQAQESYLRMTYLDTPELVARDLPSAILKSPSAAFTKAVESRFPGVVKDQASLTEIGNAIAKEMGINIPIEWQFNPGSYGYMSGRTRGVPIINLSNNPSGMSESVPSAYQIEINVGKPGVRHIKDTTEAFHQGHKGQPGFDPAAPSQARIKKLIVHELSHITAPTIARADKRRALGYVIDSHGSIFEDEVDYHNAVTLIKRNMPKGKVVLPETEMQAMGSPSTDAIFVGKNGAVYPEGNKFKVVSAMGEELGTYDNPNAAKLRALLGDSKAKLKIGDSVVVTEGDDAGLTGTIELTSGNSVKVRTKTGSIYTYNQDNIALQKRSEALKRITSDDLIDNPDLAEEVLANPSFADEPSTIDFAREIYGDKKLKVPEVPVEKVKAAAEAGVALPEPTKVNTPLPGLPSAPAPLATAPKAEGIYNPEQIYNVIYHTPGGVRETAMRGSFLNGMNDTLNSGKNAVDQYGKVVTRLVDAFPLKGDSGRVLMPELEGLEDALTNLYGRGEVGWEKTKSLFARMAVPEKVQNPLFKPIYNSVQHGIDYNQELRITGLKLLNPKSVLSLSQAEQPRLVEVLKLGNELRKEYTAEELVSKFNLNERQIQAYTNIRRAYKYGINMFMKSKKISGDYESATPEIKAAFEKNIQGTLADLSGYVSQERIGSGEKPWAVFVPGEEGKKAQFFSVFADKAEAEKTAIALGNKDYMYLRKNIIHKVTNRLSLSDLEELIDSAGIDDTAEINQLRDAIKARGALHHEIRRMDIPGYDWNLKNIVNSAIDYVEGGANRLARNWGKTTAEAMYRGNVDNMSTSMKIFARDFIDASYNTGTIGFRNVGKVLYTYNLAGNVKNLALNLTQPLTRTYPVMARYYGIGECEKEFLNSYQVAGRYLKYLITKGEGKQGLSSDLLYSLNKLHNQGVMGDQATRLMTGVNSLSEEKVEKVIGALGRFGEFTNRSHAAVSGYYVATNKLGLTGKARIEFMRDFVYRTQVAYGKHNLPQLITQSGRNIGFFKMLYTFQHYNLDNLHYLWQVMPFQKGAKAGETSRAIAAALAIGGISGVPLWTSGKSLIKLSNKVFGKGGEPQPENKIREALVKKQVPQGMIDSIIYGGPAAVGADLSASARTDLPFITPSGDFNAGGVPAAMVDRLFQAGVLLARGETGRALEKASPRVLESILKAQRIRRDGIDKLSGEQIVPPDAFNWWDISLMSLGFQTTKGTKAYEKEGVIASKQAEVTTRNQNYNDKIAKAMSAGNRDELMAIHREIRDFNRGKPREERIETSTTSIHERLKKMKGRDRPSNKMRGFTRAQEAIYGGRR